MARCRQLLALALLVSHGVVDARKIVLDPSLPCPASCRANLPPVTILASRYISTVEHAVIGTLYSTVRNSSTFATCKAHGTRTCHTMLTPYTLRNFGAAIERVIVDRVPGDVMELGVWRGGGTMYAKALLAVYGEEERRAVHLFDVFDTMSLYSGRRWDGIFGAASANSAGAIAEGFRKMGLLDERVHFHVGLFNSTTRAYRERATSDTRIAVLRIDGNFYASYEECMYNLYDFVPVGGIVIFDDILDHPDVKAFWRDFKADYGLTEEVFSAIGDGPGGTAWFRKERLVTLDWRKRRGGPGGGHRTQVSKAWSKA